MTPLQREREELILADRHLTAGEVRITEQIALIERMALQGHNTFVAKDFLRLLEETLTLWNEHRELILDAIARYELSESRLPRNSASQSKAV